MNVSASFCDGEIFLEMKEGHKVSCVNKLIFAKLLGGWYLYEILKTSSTVKAAKSMVKSWYFTAYATDSSNCLLKWRRSVRCLDENNYVVNSC